MSGTRALLVMIAGVVGIVVAFRQNPRGVSDRTRMIAQLSAAGLCVALGLALLVQPERWLPMMSGVVGSPRTILYALGLGFVGGGVALFVPGARRVAAVWAMVLLAVMLVATVAAVRRGDPTPLELATSLGSDAEFSTDDALVLGFFGMLSLLVGWSFLLRD